jgi:predicted nucleotide-binding protein
VVHGRDLAGKNAVAVFLAKLGLEAIILHEQANRGATIIEKFERHSGDVAFAVILLTADDVGGLADAPDSRLDHRARQNVIFEFGFFCAVLGRKNVCALLEKGLEKPSDIAGLVCTDFDHESDAWQMPLAKEMMAAGLPIDLNKAI